MKKKFRQMMLIVAMIATIMNGFSGVVAQASQQFAQESQTKAAKKKVSKIIVKYNKKVPIYNGEKCSKAFLKRLNLRAYAVDAKGKKLNMSVKVKEQGKYLHTSNGKITLTLVCENKTKKIKLKAISVKNVTVNKNKIELTQKQKLTEKMLKGLSFKVTWKDGKMEKNYTGAKCLDIGKRITGNKFAVRFRIGNKVKVIKFSVKKKTNPSPTPDPDPEPIPAPTVHNHFWKYVSNDEQEHEKTCFCGETKTEKHTLSQWQYVKVASDVRYCLKCNYMQIRKHEHEKEPSHIQYTFSKSNYDGTHLLEGTYMCSICNNEVKVKKSEICSYEVSYEKSSEKDIHNVVKLCEICQNKKEEKGSCEYKDDWKYSNDNREVRFCIHCNGEQTREHQHEKEPSDVQYTFSKSNNDGTHLLEGTYVCSICKNDVKVNKSENCSYEVSYEQSNEEDTHNLVRLCKICQNREEEKVSCEYKDDWKYSNDNREVRFCIHCNREQTREHQHEKEHDVQFTVGNSNNDGTHLLEGTYICNICQQEVSVIKNEDCSFDTSYERTGINDTHTIVNVCSECQFRQEKEGTCEPTGELKVIKVNLQIYEYYDCALCGDWCQRKYHIEHQFADWEYRDSREHIVYCICTEERRVETHNYVYDKNEQMVMCEGCHDTKHVYDHNHGLGTKNNMGLMDIINNKPAYNELMDTMQQKNPIPNPEKYCSRYDFLCKECNSPYCVYYDHVFEIGFCTRKGYCGGIAEPTGITSILNVFG